MLKSRLQILENIEVVCGEGMGFQVQGEREVDEMPSCEEADS